MRKPMSLDASTPGGRLRELRLRAEMTPADLGARAAKVLGRSSPLVASAVRNQENGTNGIRPDMAAAYAEVLGCDPQYILYGNGAGVGAGTNPSTESRPQSPMSLQASRRDPARARLTLDVDLPMTTALEIMRLVNEAGK